MSTKEIKKDSELWAWAERCETFHGIRGGGNYCAEEIYWEEVKRLEEEADSWK